MMKEYPNISIVKIELFQNLLCLQKRCYFEQICQQILGIIWVHITEKFADKDAKKHAFLTHKWSFERTLI